LIAADHAIRVVDSHTVNVVPLPRALSTAVRPPIRSLRRQVMLFLEDSVGKDAYVELASFTR
jgi:hypothetical protein